MTENRTRDSCIADIDVAANIVISHGSDDLRHDFSSSEVENGTLSKFRCVETEFTWDRRNLS